MNVYKIWKMLLKLETNRTMIMQSLKQIRKYAQEL